MDDTLNEAMIRSSENRGSRVEFFLLLGIAAFFRFFDLGLKPPHFDEGINGHFVLQIWREGFYHYDPTNFHGPLYFYLCHLAEVLLGRGVESFRVMNAALSLGLIAMVYQFRSLLGRTAVWAAWFLAISPAFVFYGRYAIHETLFTLGQVLFVYGRLSWLRRPTSNAIWYMTAGVVILLTTKETFFIFLGTWFIAELCIWLLDRWRGERQAWSSFKDLVESDRRALLVDGAAAAGLGAVAIFLLFSGFFENPRGFEDFFRAFDFWSKTGTKGNGHEKVWYYWFQLLWRYEIPLLIGLGFLPIIFWHSRRYSRFQLLILLFGLGHFLAYTIIPYKTPWLILGFWPLAFFASPARAHFVAPAILPLALSGWGTWNLNFNHYADPKEPYVYVQTTNDYKEVIGLLERKVKKNPEMRNGQIVVLLQDTWPLPYTLNLYPHLRYARLADIDRDRSLLDNADLVLIDGNHLEGIRKVLPKRFARMRFQLRDAYEAGWALFDFNQFQDVLAVDVPLEEPKNEGESQ